MQSRTQCRATINWILLGRINLHLFDKNILHYYQVLHNFKSCKIAQKPWKAEKSWMGESLRTPTIFVYPFQSLQFCWLYLIKYKLKYIFSLARNYTMGIKQDQSFPLVPLLNVFIISSYKKKEQVTLFFYIQ